VAESETTTIEIKTQTWAVLDKRKERGDSFDDVIRRLVDATPVGYGEMKTDAAIEGGEIEQLTDSEINELEEQCSHFDVIAGETCNESPVCRQKVFYGDDSDGDWFYYCDEHAPE
jgi:predicted CopG family antitoxin